MSSLARFQIFACFLSDHTVGGINPTPPIGCKNPANNGMNYVSGG